MFKPTQPQPMLMPRNPVAPVAYSRFALWQPRTIQPAARPAQHATTGRSALTGSPTYRGPSREGR